MHNTAATAQNLIIKFKKWRELSSFILDPRNSRFLNYNTPRDEVSVSAYTIRSEAL